MAIKRFQVRLTPVSGIPADSFVNTLYYDLNFPADVEGVCDDIFDAYDAMLFTAGWNGIEIRVYDLEGGEPIYRKKVAIAAAGTTTGPSEVAVCLSYAAVDDVEASTARRRGRIYVGPIGSTEAGKPRPSAAVIDSVLDFGEQLAQVGFASNVTWHMFSQSDQSAHKIETIWVDDAWDIQRRRGVLPSARTVRDVQ